MPTGSTDLVGANGLRLPASLQPGSGSIDLFLGSNWTYTGLFTIKRLVADSDSRLLIRSQGSQATRLGSEFASRLWLSYRPYEARNGTREWFVGPALTWLHAQDDRIAGVGQSGSGGDVLLAGLTTYIGMLPGVHLWLAIDWGAAMSRAPAFEPLRRRISAGITRQFSL